MAAESQRSRTMSSFVYLSISKHRSSILFVGILESDAKFLDDCDCVNDDRLGFVR